MHSNLSFNEHIKQSVSSCMKKLHQINRIKNLFKRSTLEMIIQSQVFSKLFYCSAVWSSTSLKNICQLQIVQNFAARIMTGSRKYHHITPVLRQLKWLPMDKILYFRDCVMTFKCMKKLVPDYLCQKFVTRSAMSNRVTRQSKQLHKPLYRTSKAQKSFLYRASTIWNDLDDSLKSSATVQSFKCKLRKNLLTHFLDESKS